MKVVYRTGVLIALLVLSPTIFAKQCGGGKILEVKEGGWDTDDLYIKVDYSDFNDNHPGTNFSGYIRFAAGSMPALRLEAIRRLAITALISGKTVLAYSHSNNCSDASELTIFASR